MPKLHRLFFTNNTKHNLNAWPQWTGDEDKLLIRVFDEPRIREPTIYLPKHTTPIGSCNTPHWQIKGYLEFFSGRLRYEIQDDTRHALFETIYKRPRRGIHHFNLEPAYSGGFSIFEPLEFSEITIRNQSDKPVLISTSIGMKGLAELHFSYHWRHTSCCGDWHQELEPGEMIDVPSFAVKRLIGITPQTSGLHHPEDQQLTWDFKQIYDRIEVEINSKE